MRAKPLSLGKQRVLHLATAFSAHGMLAKPFSPEELLAAIYGVLLDQDLHREASVCRHAQPRQF